MLSVSDINVFYRTTQVLWDVSFEVAEKEIVVILGANGAGKSSVLRSISGLTNCRSGRISFCGERIDNVPAHKIVGKKIALVPEGGAIFSQMTVRENLELGAHLTRDRRQVKKTIEWVSELFPVLKQKAKTTASNLSGGERQMLSIAKALMLRPELFLLDEPSYGLAPLVVKEVFRVIERLRDQGATILVVEQSTKHALAVGDRGYILENGRIVMSGRCDELQRNEQVKKAYLGM